MKPDHRGRSGRHSARPAKNGPSSINGPFVPLRKELIESDALGCLGLAARRCLDRLLSEHMAQGGRENGKLKATYDDFAAFGVRRASIPAALRELEGAGLVVIEVRGRGGNREYRKASVYRITSFPPKTRTRQTNGALTSPPLPEI